jgi:hypothetical protein
MVRTRFSPTRAGAAGVVVANMASICSYTAMGVEGSVAPGDSGRLVSIERR